jgi:DNA-binding SARP family transcriptional activator
VIGGFVTADVAGRHRQGTDGGRAIPHRPRLRLYVFGSLHIEVDRTALVPSPGTGRLLGYLATTPRSQAPREEMAGTLWPEATSPRAFTALRTALSRVRRELGEGWIASEQQLVGLGDEVWCDTREVSRAVDDLGRDDEGDLHRLRDALALYTGDALRGTYEDWALRERDRLRDITLLGYERLLERAIELEDWDLVLETSLSGLAVEPLMESFHRGAILAHGRRGNPAAAMRQYNRLGTLLWRELRIRPSAMTKRALEQALTGA